MYSSPVLLYHAFAYLCAESVLVNLRRYLSPLECFVVAQLVSVIVDHTSGTLGW